MIVDQERISEAKSRIEDRADVIGSPTPEEAYEAAGIENGPELHDALLNMYGLEVGTAMGIGFVVGLELHRMQDEESGEVPE